MVYAQPRTRSCAPLAGQKNYPSPGSVLDLRRFVRSAFPAGANGRPIAVADVMCDPSDLNRPIRFCGNNQGFSLTQNFTKDKMMEAAEKFAARGINLIRFHAPENYLMTDGAQGTAGSGRPGTCNFSPARWDEFCYFIYCLRLKGIHYGINIAGGNLGVDMGTVNRFDATLNVTGAATANFNGTGGLTKPTITNAGSNHTHAPTVIVSVPDGKPGYGAKIRAVVSNGQIVDHIVDDPGRGYQAGQVTISYFGGYGRMKLRVRIDADIRKNWLDLLKALILPVNHYTATSILNDQACVVIECYNESHMTAPFGSAGIISQLFQTQLKPTWQDWLSARYQDNIANLNTAYGGTTFTEFSDAGLLYKQLTFNPTTKAERLLWSDSKTWMNENDIWIFKYYVDQIKALGFTGQILTRDMGGDMDSGMTVAETGATGQGNHAYLALQDAYTSGSFLSSNATRNNGPSTYGQNALLNTMATLINGIPKWQTECGQSMPSRYRGEMGAFYAAMGSLYDYSGLVYHSSSAGAVEFGPSNPTQLKGLFPHQWEQDPLTNASVWLGNLIFHRRDIDTLPVAKIVVQNKRCVANYPVLADRPADIPFSSTQQYVLGNYYLLLPIMRVETQWDYTNAASVATTWQATDNRDGAVNESIASIFGRAKYGWNNNHEAYRWYVTEDNQDANLNGDSPYNGARYTQNRQVFMDRIAGLFGINTARSQVACPSKPFRNQLGTKVKQGVGFVANATRNQKGLPGNGYNLNFMGNRFWQNLLINHIEDGVLLGVTSASMDPISTASKIVIVVAGNFYNKGATWQPVVNGVAGVAVTTRGTYTVAPWVRFDGNGNGAIGRCILGADGGIDSVEIVERGVNYSSTPTASLQGGTGSGGVLGAVTMTADDEQREVKLLTPYTADGQEGWPIGQARHVADFTITGVDPLANWRMYELDFSGKRIGTVRTRRTKTGINIRIDSSRTVQPSVFFELVKE